MINFKKCPKCNIEKEFSFFYLKNNRPYSKCKQCIREENFSNNIILPIKLEGEIWKDVFGYENLYKVSNFGHIISLSRKLKKSNNDNYITRERMLKILISKTGYNVVSLSLNKKVTIEYVHRLVAIAFIPNPENKPEVNHKDGDKTNSNVCNLEWVTPKENVIHAVATGLSNHINGENHCRSKLKSEDVLKIRELHSNHTITQIAKMYNFSSNGIKSIINRKTWKHI